MKHEDDTDPYRYRSHGVFSKPDDADKYCSPWEFAKKPQDAVGPEATLGGFGKPPHIFPHLARRSADVDVLLKKLNDRDRLIDKMKEEYQKYEMELQAEHSREIRGLRLEVEQLRMEKANVWGIFNLTKKYLKFFVFACHPDRNPGRPEALEVTKELLKLRG